MRYTPLGFSACIGIIGAAAFLFFLLSPRVECRMPSPKAFDLSNIRALAQASLIYASDHDDQLPHASDIWDYMRQLAEDGILNDAEILLSRLDPAVDFTHRNPISILAPEQPGQPRQLNPRFRQLKPSIAVALGSLNAKMPATVPIAWTRGLQTKGVWADDSPYGSDGGYIAFMGGRVQFYHDLSADGGQLDRFDGQEKTADILEALPPGSRIGEYTPAAGEQIAWARITASRQHHDFWSDHLPPERWPIVAIWLLFAPIACHRLARKRTGAVRMFIWPLLLTFLWLAYLAITEPMY